MGELKMQPLKKRGLYRDEVRKAIKDAILNKDLKPGDRIIETRWAHDLGVSQAPVREAIRELEVMGLVENIPYQGSFVRELTAKDLRDCYQVRMSLEELGVRNACRYISAEQLAVIRNTLDDMETVADRQDFNEYVHKDALFHQEIIDVSDNKMLLRLWDQCNILEWTYVGTQFSTQPLKVLAKRHEILYEAIAARDEERAVKESHRHITQLIEELNQREASEKERV